MFVHALRKQSDGARDNDHAGLVDVMGKVNRSFGPTPQLAVKANYHGEGAGGHLAAILRRQKPE